MKALWKFLFFPLLYMGQALLLADEPQEAPPSAMQKLTDQLANMSEATQIKKKFSKKNNSRLVSIFFENEDLVDVINFLASEKGVNVVLPSGAHALNNKVTLHYPERIPLDQAWQVLFTVLDVAGYGLIEKGDTYTIVKTGKEIGREPVPIYINVKAAELPNTDQRIRYVYYLTNLRVSDQGNDEVLGILKDILPDTSTFRFDTQSNAVVIADKANNIKQVAAILATLDEAEIQDKPTVIQLLHVPAQWLADLLNEQVLRNTTDPNKLRLMDARKQQESFYFSRAVRIVPVARNNRLVLLGKPQAVQRLKDFIFKNIDIDLDSGKSVLHVYQLQYLDAEKFAPVLERIVESKKEGGTEQSKSEAEAGTFERYFGEVKIMVDRPKTASGETPEGTSLGSNNLIVAARNDDWDRIKRLIEELDIPQPLVIIELLIADLSLTDARALGNNLRNPGILSPPNVNFQSAQIPCTALMTDSNTNPTTLQADLLRTAFTGNTCPPTQGSSNSYLESLPAGATFVSLSDPSTGQTWSIWQVLQQFSSTRILYHPHVISTNNKKAEIIIQEERLLADEASGTTGGTTTATNKWVPAKLSLQITPRISVANTVNLHVVVDISNFLSATSGGAQDPTSGNRTDRNVTTNANVPSGSVLCLGGLTQIDTTHDLNETPLLGRIPIIGWFFKERDASMDKSNLMVFITPTIVEPRLRGGAGNYTRDHVEFAKTYCRQGLLFDNLRDPITRWFFNPIRKDAQSDLDEFVMRDELMSRDLALRGTAEGGLIMAKNNSPQSAPRPSSPVMQRAENPVVLAQRTTPASTVAQPMPPILAPQKKAVVVAQATEQPRTGTVDERTEKLRNLLAQSDMPKKS